MKTLFGCWVIEDDYQQKGGKGRLSQMIRPAVMGRMTQSILSDCIRTSGSWQCLTEFAPMELRILRRWQKGLKEALKSKNILSIYRPSSKRYTGEKLSPVWEGYKGTSILRRGMGFCQSKKRIGKDEENSGHLLMKDLEVQGKGTGEGFARARVGVESDQGIKS